MQVVLVLLLFYSFAEFLRNTPDRHGASFKPISLSCFFQAYRWCIEAMKEITPGLPVKVVVDVLRQASKVNCVHLYYKIFLIYYWGHSVVAGCMYRTAICCA